MSGKKKRVEVLRAVIVCIAATGVVAGAAWTGSGNRRVSKFAEPDSIFQGMIPLPPGAWGLSHIGDAMNVNGIPMRMANFHVEMKPENVMLYYIDAFSREGLDIDGTAIQEDGGAMIAWDHVNGLQRSIKVFRQGSGSSVFPSIVGIRSSDSGNMSDLPLPPGPTASKLISDVVSRDGNRLSRTLTMITRLDHESASEDLKRRLILGGFRIIEKTDNIRSGMVEALDRKGRRHVYTFAPGNEYTTVMVIVEES